MALLTMAAGSVAGCWDVITPARLGITGPEGDRLAGGGMVLVSGYRDEDLSQGVTH